MKSEERHHLAKNDLQQTLNRWLDELEPYSNHILGGILLATALAVAVILWMRTSEASVAAGWTELAAARSADEFLKVAEDFPGSTAAEWARLRAARLLYQRAVETSLTNRAASDDDFNEARDLFNAILKGNPPKEIREAALDGIARVLESTSSGDLKDAIDAYETLVREFPQSIYADYAKHRVEVLKQPTTQEFYAWFRKQSPKPVDRPLPKDGATADDPFAGLNLPDIDLSPDTKTPPAKGTTTTPPEGTLTVPPLPETGDAPKAPAEGAAPPAAEPAAEPAKTPDAEPAKSESSEATPPASSEPAPPAETPPPPAN